ncbi:MAG: DUF2752 domain-containing protein [Desulfarculus sp.]|nr:DUF2752 domain-containing protein [Desulfarculus sp.]
MPGTVNNTAAAARQRLPGPGGQGLPAGLWLFSLLLVLSVVPLGASGQALASHLPAWPCLFQEFSGWPCPLCGLTRSLLCVGRLQLTQAMEFNPAGAVLFAWACLFAVLGWAGLAGKPRWLGFLWSKGQVFLVCAVILSSWALRLAGLAWGQ